MNRSYVHLVLQMIPAQTDVPHWVYPEHRQGIDSGLNPSSSISATMIESSRMTLNATKTHLQSLG